MVITLSLGYWPDDRLAWGLFPTQLLQGAFCWPFAIHSIKRFKTRDTADNLAGFSDGSFFLFCSINSTAPFGLHPGVQGLHQ